MIDKLDPEPWLAIAGNRLDLSANGFRGDMTRIYPNDAQEDGQHQVTRSITSESAQQQPSNIYVEWGNKPSRWGSPTDLVQRRSLAGAQDGYEGIDVLTQRVEHRGHIGHDDLTIGGDRSHHRNQDAAGDHAATR